MEPKYRWARSRNGRTPARFKPNGLPVGRQSRCRLAPSNPLKAKMDGAAKAWQHHWAQASSGTIVPVGTQPKRQNPSRIQAKRVALWSAEPVPFGTFEPAKSKDGWGCKGLAAPLGTSPSIEWYHSTGGHAAETAGPQQDSGPTACHLVGRAAVTGEHAAETAEPQQDSNGLPFGRQSRCRLAPSNPLKAKMDGAAKAWQHHWALAQATSGTKVPVGTQPKRQNPSKIQAKRVAIWSAEPVPFGTFEPAKSKDGWGCEGLAAPLGPSIEWNHSTGGAGAVWHLRWALA